jgi:hypothetical protein
LIAGRRELVTEKGAYKGLQVHLELWKVTHALTTTNCITCGSNVQGADINMVEHVSAIYNLARVTKFSEFSMVIDTTDYFKFLHPKGTSAAQDMVLIIHQGPLNMALSPGARHRGDTVGDTDTENLRLLLSCPHKLEVPPEHVDLFLSVAGTAKTREGTAAAAAKAAVKEAKDAEEAAAAAWKEGRKAAKEAKDAAAKEAKDAAKAEKRAEAAAKKAAFESLTPEQQKEAVELEKKEKKDRHHGTAEEKARQPDAGGEGRRQPEAEGRARRLDGGAEGRSQPLAKASPKGTATAEEEEEGHRRPEGPEGPRLHQAASFLLQPVGAAVVQGAL